MLMTKDTKNIHVQLEPNGLFLIAKIKTPHFFYEMIFARPFHRGKIKSTITLFLHNEIKKGVKL
jgi:hypothetical protein